MKRLLLGAVLLSTFSLSDLYMKNNCLPRMDTSNIKFRGNIIHKDIKEIKFKTLSDTVQEILNKKKHKKNKVKKTPKVEKHKENRIHPIKFTLTFYTSLPEENGGHTVTCRGEKLRYGMVASNVYHLGTKIKIKGLGTFTVSDRGGANFNSPNRLDVLIERNGGESDADYLNRVNNMGKLVRTGYIENKNLK